MQRFSTSAATVNRPSRPSASPPADGARDLFPETLPSSRTDSENERYTTRETLEWCRARAGVDRFDLDVAACHEAHCARRFFSLADDGLRCDWFGDVWCNPPWDSIRPWVERTWLVCRDRTVRSVSMLLPGNRTEQPWWQDLVEPVRDGRRTASLGFPPHVELTSHFLPGRVVYGCPGNRDAVGAGSPPFTSVLLLFKVHPAATGAKP